MRLALPLWLIASLCACAASPDARLTALFDSGTENLWRGELTRALSIAEDGARQSASLVTTQWPARFRLLQAETLVVMREPAKAAAILKEEIPPADTFAPLRAKHRYLQGQLLVVQGRIADALPVLDQAAMQSQDAGAIEVWLDTQALKGQALMRLGRWAEGEQTLNVAITRAGEGGRDYHQAVALVNLGMGEVVRNRYDAALPLFERVTRFEGLQARMVYAAALSNAGICHFRLGEFERAITMQRRAITAYEQSGKPDVYLEQALGVLGAIYISSGDLKQGMAYLQRALDAARKGNRLENAARWADDLATASVTLGAWDEAEQINSEAARLNRLAGSRTFVFNTVNRARIAEGRGRGDDAAALYREALADPTALPETAWEAHAGLARLAVARHELPRASREFETALALVERTQSDLRKTDYKLSFVTRVIRFYTEYIDVLIEQGRYEEALIVADSSRARVLAERHGIAAPLRRTSAALRRIAGRLDATIWFYWLGSAGSYVWTVDANRIQFLRLSVTAAEVESRVRDYRDAIERSLINPLDTRSASGDALYESLVAPVAGTRRGTARVVVVPDGAMTMLNLETLPVPQPKRHYWIEDVELAVAPSLSVFPDRPAADVPGRKGVLLIGAPQLADPAYPTLRYASAEIAAISNAFAGKAVVYTGDKASPDQYRDTEPQRYGIVHFTAHAAANAESPLDSAVILSRDASGYKLYARDVAEVPLSADLVTISACRSAGERTYAGEGLVGFAWAFLRAGSKRVIAGLWDVDDRSTADLMKAVYERIAAGDSPSVSLRAAKLAMITRGGAIAKPDHWGPFQLFVGSTAVP